MSYELTFWRQQPGVHLDPGSVYSSLKDEQEVSGLRDLPIEPLLAKLAEQFPGAIREPNGDDEWLIWTRNDELGGLEVIWSTQHVCAYCRGLSNEEMNRVIDVGNEFDCPLYDPQTEERFAPYGG